jgi:hypothetical protein
MDVAEGDDLRVFLVEESSEVILPPTVAQADAANGNAIARGGAPSPA